MHSAAPIVLGLDIGGANFKAATSTGAARTVPFPLWQKPDALARELKSLIRQFPHERLAVTMTGELCDCFATKRAGVAAILDAVHAAAPTTPIQVWSTLGHFVDLTQAKADPWRVAAANWHALATYAGRLVPQGAALLIDVGSTTTDVIPLWNGQPTPQGWTDPERLASSELVYTGVRRTPVCAVLGPADGCAAELFATMLDVYLLLKKIPEEPANRDTADGRPATRAAAHSRLARMVCSDVERFSMRQALDLARRAGQRQAEIVGRAIAAVGTRLLDGPRRIVLTGIGDPLARQALALSQGKQRPLVISLHRKLSRDLANAACAHAVAWLAVAS